MVPEAGVALPRAEILHFVRALRSASETLYCPLMGQCSQA
jgi:hypothetical protein